MIGKLALVLVLAPAGLQVRADELCEVDQDADTASIAQDIARIACEEHALWKRPFIDLRGRYGKTGLPMEAESDRLENGLPAWRRVARYWIESGTLAQSIADRSNGARECSSGSKHWPDAAMCRAFLVDNAWSAAFVSYVMKRAGLADFRFSYKHNEYIHDAFANPRSPYALADPKRTKPAIGDLLCYSREGDVEGGFEGLKQALERGAASYRAHCDIVVAIDLNGDSKLYAVGGNVMQAVTMRKLALQGGTALATLPARIQPPPDCSINDVEGCNDNRKDWIALLKLKR